jgi:hypothetical protein
MLCNGKVAVIIDNRPGGLCLPINAVSAQSIFRLPRTGNKPSRASVIHADSVHSFAVGISGGDGEIAVAKVEATSPLLVVAYRERVGIGPFAGRNRLHVGSLCGRLESRLPNQSKSELLREEWGAPEGGVNWSRSTKRALL